MRKSLETLRCKWRVPTNDRRIASFGHQRRRSHCGMPGISACCPDNCDGGLGSATHSRRFWCGRHGHDFQPLACQLRGKRVYGSCSQVDRDRPCISEQPVLDQPGRRRASHHRVRGSRASAWMVLQRRPCDRRYLWRFLNNSHYQRVGHTLSPLKARYVFLCGVRQ